MDYLHYNIMNSCRRTGDIKVVSSSVRKKKLPPSYAMKQGSLSERLLVRIQDFYNSGMALVPDEY